MVYQWHREGFDLPSDGTLLARGDIFENQAFSVNDTAFGIQFHSELTYAMACRWTVRGAERFTLPKAQARPEHMAGWFRYDPAIRAWLWNFLDTWLAHDKRGLASSARPEPRVFAPVLRCAARGSGAAVFIRTRMPPPAVSCTSKTLDLRTRSLSFL